MANNRVIYQSDALYASKTVNSSDEHHAHSPLENFEHSLKLFVDFGLFFFAFANAKD